MKKPYTDLKGLSDTVSVILVIALVLVLAMVIYAMVFGAVDPKYMKKSAYVAGSVDSVDIPRNSGLTDHILKFLPQTGDPFYFSGQQTTGTTGTRMTLRLLSPDGKILSPNTASLIGSPYGRQIYIFPNNSGSANVCDYEVSDKIPPANLRPMPVGRWTLQLVDEELHVLADSYDTTLKYGTPSLPVAQGFIGGLFKADCSPYQQMIGGSSQTFTNGPGNMTYTRFNGVNTFLRINNDPGLSLTGDMALSMWLRPTATGNSADPSTWHQIIGKGSIDGSTENDNYQMFQIGDKLVFEWNDATSGNHYQAITTSPVLSTSWNYVTTSVSNGVVTIYNNGVAQPLVYSQGLDPRSITSPVPNPPVVNLKTNANSVTVGMQNSSSSSAAFYYKGDIGAYSLYNRALTQQEIANNYATNRA
jgi:hypothetical protein